MKSIRHIIREESGMTLVELVVVIVILGILAATVGPKLFRNVEKAKEKEILHQIEIFRGAINMYRLDTGYVPTTQQGLNVLVTNPGVDGWDGPYLEKNELPLDPWKNPYAYQAPGTEGRDYDIISYGRDKAPGGEGEDKDIIE